MPTVEGSRLPFAEAIQFFAGKINITTERWDDLVGEAHDVAFTTAGATSASLLQDVRTAVQRAIEEGTSFEQFKAEFSATVERNGWSHRGGREWRAQLIYRQNLYAAYAAGRYQQMTAPGVLQRRPYWQYRHGGSLNPRLAHLAHDGKVYPADSAFWNRWYPPSGFGCSCSVFSLSEADLKRLGLQSEEPPGDTVAVVDPSTGQTRQVRNEPDPGFAYAPGRAAREGRREKVLAETLARLDPDLRRELEKFVGKVPEPEPVLPPEPEPVLPPEPEPQTWEDFVARGRRTFAQELTAIEATEFYDRRLISLRDRVRQIERDLASALTSDPDQVKFLRRELKSLNRDYSEEAKKQENRAQAFARLREAIFEGGDRTVAQASAKQIKLPRQSKDNPHPPTEYRSALEDLYTFTSNQVTTLEKLYYKRSRAFAAKPGVRYQGEGDDLTGRINVGRSYSLADQIETLWHEYGHHLEFSNPTYATAARAWIQARASSDSPQQLRTLVPGSGYGTEEVAYPDDFVSPYVGKYYVDGSTEVVSMGLEHFATPELMQRLYETDRQHFDLILGMLR